MTCHLSIIIPTRNRADYLSRALASIVRQKYDPRQFEVLVIDNGSSDSTRVVCDKYLHRFNNVAYHFEKNPGLHSGRNAALKISKGDILVYVDDDIQTFPYWLEAIATAFKDKHVALVGGKCLPLFESPPPPWLNKMWQKKNSDGQLLPFLSILDLGDSIKEISPLHVFGCNFSIRKHVLLEAGGFHPDAMPPDLIRYRGDGETHVSQFVSENGYQTLYHPRASVYHNVSNARMTEHYFCKRSYTQGISDSYTQFRNGGFKHHWVILALKTIKRLPLFCMNHLQARAFNAYIKGYLFHRKEVCKDPELHEWVTRKTYLE